MWFVFKKSGGKASTNPKSTVYDAKRLIGRKFLDTTVQKDKSLLPFIVMEKGGKILVEVVTGPGSSNCFNPEEISAMILGKMKETAEAFLGCKVSWLL